MKKDLVVYVTGMYLDKDVLRQIKFWSVKSPFQNPADEVLQHTMEDD